MEGQVIIKVSKDGDKSSYDLESVGNIDNSDVIESLVAGTSMFLAAIKKEMNTDDFNGLVKTIVMDLMSKTDMMISNLTKNK